MDQDITTFKEICPPEHTNKMAAAHYFTVLLGMYNLQSKKSDI